MVGAYSDTLNQDVLSFSQFDDENSSPLLNNSDLDPHTNFFNSTTNIECRYISPCEMCKNVIDLQPWLLHINCRSIRNKLNDIYELLKTMKTEPIVIAVSELWLDNDELDFYGILGYEFIAVCRPHGKNGLPFNKKTEYCYMESYIEAIFIEIKIARRNCICGCIYRPPNANTDLFIAKLGKTLKAINKENTLCCILGDYNIDLLKLYTESGANDLLDTLATKFFSQQ